MIKGILAILLLVSIGYRVLECYAMDLAYIAPVYLFLGLCGLALIMSLDKKGD